MTTKSVPNGYSHIFNAQSKNVLAGLYHYYPEHCTIHQLSELIEQPYQNVARVLERWTKHHFGYTTRKRDRSCKNCIKYLYRLKPKGLKALIEFTHRQNLGFDLNRRRITPIKVESYTVKTKQKNRKSCNVCDSAT